MGYYFNTSEDLETGTETLQHFGILGQKHGQRNGPPYPLGSGDHSSSEKSAAKAAGVSVGSDSGKGSIDNVKKKRSKTAKKKPLTPEEKRQLALDAAKSGDKKKIAKNMDQLSTDELRDAQARAQLKDALTRKDPSEQKMSRAEVEKRDAILSGDKEKVKQYAGQMTTQELRDAMEKVRLTTELNHVDPPPTAMDKLKKFSESADNFRQAAEKCIGLYNLTAKVYNSSHKDGTKWPIIGEQKKEKEKTPEEKTAEALAKVFGKDVKNTAKENSGETDKRIKELQDQVNSLKNKGNKKEEKKGNQPEVEDKIESKSKYAEAAREFNEGAEQYFKEYGTRPNVHLNEDSAQPQRKYTAERAPQFKKSFFNTSKKEEAKPQEPTEEQKRLVEDARKSDERYLEQLRNSPSRQEVKTMYESVKDTPISSYDKIYQKDINDAFDDIMSDYNESVRRQQVIVQERRDRAQTVEDAKKYYRDAIYEGDREASRYWWEVIRNNE